MARYILVVIALASVFGVLYFIYNPSNPGFFTSIIFSVLTGFVAGLLTPVLAYLATGKTVQDLVTNEFSGILQQIYAEYAPQKTYKPNDSLEGNFNTDLSNAIENARKYTFVGETAVHVPSRIMKRESGNGVLHSIEVVLAFSPEKNNLDQPYQIFGTDLKQSKRVAILAAILALREVAAANPVRSINLFLVGNSLGFRFEETDTELF